MAGFISKVPDRANSSCRCVKPAVIVRAILHRSSQETTCDFKKSQRDPKEDFRIIATASSPGNFTYRILIQLNSQVTYHIHETPLSTNIPWQDFLLVFHIG